MEFYKVNKFALVKEVHAVSQGAADSSLCNEPLQLWWGFLAAYSYLLMDSNVTLCHMTGSKLDLLIKEKKGIFEPTSIIDTLGFC